MTIVLKRKLYYFSIFVNASVTNQIMPKHSLETLATISKL